MKGYGLEPNKAERMKLERRQRAYNYLCSVGLSAGIPCKIEGNNLIFHYTMQTMKGMQNFERKVDLGTFQYKDRLIKGYKYTGVMYNIYTQQFTKY